MRVCVFCGSSAGKGSGYLAAAEDVGRTLTAAGVGLVYGGAGVGTMGAVADAAVAAGGEVIGVIPQSLVDREIAHPGLSELHVVADLHERKAKMASLSDAFLALPGGAGTLEELFEVFTWAQLGLHAKPIALLDVGGFYRPVLEMLDHMAAEGFLRPEYRDMLIVETAVERVLDRYKDYSPSRPKWARSDEE
ncbi:LOG family protein [Actinophytocola gossypii]|uniref:Cytokinin riboside 5'-monophosphate phosphoribohydrolase n=1 Tax=Actinophytocola gossypii TaxID=2812003 RepID=A0ABT2J5R2_9PSEU|nr:TIGR00730 family Rossman fold protein [Actinophytocola gossypii]MCT2583199.1 TIGR00730 family Rossman fold protein [Actinophytocola gossypii]